MKLQLLLVAVCLCAASVSAGGVPKKLLKKYAMKKIMESCLGKDVLYKMKEEMMAACDKCHGEAGPEMPELRSQLLEMFQPVMPGYRPLVQYVPVPVQYQPVGRYQRRWKRSAHGHHDMSPEKIEYMQEKIRSKVGNITCVLREMNMLDENNQVKFSAIKQRIMAMPLDQPLIDDMCKFVDQCRDFSSCIPSEVFSSTPIKGFGKQMAFFKCFKKTKLEACMKHEFREEYYPMLAAQGLELGEEETFATIYTAAMLDDDM